MYLSNTTLFDGRGISSIYYTRYNYMFRRLTMAIFRYVMKYLVSSYTRLNMGCKQWEVGVDMDTRSRICHAGWEVWVRRASAIICISELIIGLWYIMYVVEIVFTHTHVYVCMYVCMYVYIYIYIYIYTHTHTHTHTLIHLQYTILYKNMDFCNYKLINSSCYILLLY